MKLCTVKGNQKISKQPQFEVSNSKKKDLVQQCSFKKVWKIALLIYSAFSYERFLFKYKQLQKEKGQKISEGNLNVFNLPKKSLISDLASKKWLYLNVKALCFTN